MPFSHKNDLIGIFAQHKVAANLLMIMMILAGAWALAKLNTQFFPNFALDVVTVRVTWTGAAAEDVEESITNPLERDIRNSIYAADVLMGTDEGSMRYLSAMREQAAPADGATSEADARRAAREARRAARQTDNK